MFQVVLLLSVIDWCWVVCWHLFDSGRSCCTSQCSVDDQIRL